MDPFQMVAGLLFPATFVLSKFPLGARLVLLSCALLLPLGYVSNLYLNQVNGQIEARKRELILANWFSSVDTLLFRAIDHRSAMLNGNLRAARSVEANFAKDLKSLESVRATLPSGVTDFGRLRTISSLYQELVAAESNLTGPVAMVSHDDLISEITALANQARRRAQPGDHDLDPTDLKDPLLVQLPALALKTSWIRENAVLSFKQKWSATEQIAWAASNRAFPFDAIDDVRVDFNQFLSGTSKAPDLLKKSYKGFVNKSQILKTHIRKAAIEPEVRIHTKRIAIAANDLLVNIKRLHQSTTGVVAHNIRAQANTVSEYRRSGFSIAGLVFLGAFYLIAAYGRSIKLDLDKREAQSTVPSEPEAPRLVTTRDLHHLLTQNGVELARLNKLEHETDLITETVSVDDIIRRRSEVPTVAATISKLDPELFRRLAQSVGKTQSATAAVQIQSRTEEEAA